MIRPIELTPENTEFQTVTYQIRWYAEIGTIGDSEGRTWSKDLLYSQAHPSREMAEMDLASQPGIIFPGKWTKFEHSEPYRVCRIRRAEEKLSDDKKERLSDD